MTAVGTNALPAAAGRTLFGRVMLLVALTVGTATLGVFVARKAGGALWFVAWLAALACLVALNVANARGNRGLALVLLLAFGLLIGASVSSTVNYYSQTDPTAVRRPSVRRRCSWGASELAVMRCAGTFRFSTGCCSGCCWA